MVLAMDRALVPLIGRGLRRDQFGDADQIVGDQVEQEIGSNGSDAAVLGLAHCAVLFAPAEDAFGHRPARLRHAVALVPRGASVDGAAATLAVEVMLSFRATCGVTLMARRLVTWSAVS